MSRSPGDSDQTAAANPKHRAAVSGTGAVGISLVARLLAIRREQRPSAQREAAPAATAAKTTASAAAVIAAATATAAILVASGTIISASKRLCMGVSEPRT
jgi:hypothetical protein